MEKNKVKFGLSRIYYSKITTNEEGKRVYATPKPMIGAVSLSLEAQGESVEWYADNILFYASATNAGYQGNLEMARLTDEFRRDIYGDVMDSESGVQYERADAEPAHFAMLFQFEGDAHAVRHCLYDCVAARPAVASQTTSNTKEPQTSTIQITAAPLDTGIVKASTTDNTTTDVYNAWFNQITEAPASILEGGTTPPAQPAAAKVGKQPQED